MCPGPGRPPHFNCGLHAPERLLARPGPPAPQARSPEPLPLATVLLQLAACQINGKRLHALKLKASCTAARAGPVAARGDAAGERDRLGGPGPSQPGERRPAALRTESRLGETQRCQGIGWAGRAGCPFRCREPVRPLPFRPAAVLFPSPGSRLSWRRAGGISALGWSGSSSPHGCCSESGLCLLQRSHPVRWAGRDWCPVQLMMAGLRWGQSDPA